MDAVEDFRERDYLRRVEERVLYAGISMMALDVK